jgi:hypothetical protein
MIVGLKEGSTEMQRLLAIFCRRLSPEDFLMETESFLSVLTDPKLSEKLSIAFLAKAT